VTAWRQGCEIDLEPENQTQQTDERSRYEGPLRSARAAVNGRLPVNSDGSSITKVAVECAERGIRIGSGVFV